MMEMGDRDEPTRYELQIRDSTLVALSLHPITSIRSIKQLQYADSTLFRKRQSYQSLKYIDIKESVKVDGQNHGIFLETRKRAVLLQFGDQTIKGTCTGMTPWLLRGFE
jgi:hypothetical protein